MSEDPVAFVAKIIKQMSPEDRRRLLDMLMDDGGTAGVAVTPPGEPPSKEGAAFADWPAEYFESME